MAQAVKRDTVKQAWEAADTTEFPLVCETCLGDNPYVRMTKEAFGKKCKVCEVPFTVFAWQAGTKGRLKRVEICRNCAVAKNVCQVCIYDLQYGLPVKVRDKVLRETTAEASSVPTGAMIPQSHANRSWYTAQQQQMIAAGHDPSKTTSNELAHAKLRDMAVMEPRYERNLPKLCSFFARGECDRGMNCPFRHELPRDRDDPMSKQNTKDRFYGTSDPVANKILGRKRRQEELQEKRDNNILGSGGDGESYEKDPCTLFMRFQNHYNHGDDKAAPPAMMTELDVRDFFYSFGEIVSVRVHPERGHAFVQYSSSDACELAVSSCNRTEFLGRKITCSFARAPKRGEQVLIRGEAASASSIRGDVHSMAPTCRIVPPPGGAIASAAPPSSSASANNNNIVIPMNGLPNVRLPPEVARMTASRINNGGLGIKGDSPQSSVSHRPRGGVPRPGGLKLHQPLYPSSDPNRLGSNSVSKQL